MTRPYPRAAFSRALSFSLILLSTTFIATGCAHLTDDERARLIGTGAGIQRFGADMQCTGAPNGQTCTVMPWPGGYRVECR